MQCDRPSVYHISQYTFSISIKLSLKCAILGLFVIAKVSVIVMLTTTTTREQKQTTREQKQTTREQKQTTEEHIK